LDRGAILPQPPLRYGFISPNGGGFGRDDVVLRDHLRQTEIEALGWTVVRFTNDTALGEPWRINDAIRDRARVLGFLYRRADDDLLPNLKELDGNPLGVPDNPKLGRRRSPRKQASTTGRLIHIILDAAAGYRAAF
jgi:hypothetical protein